jgi:hypothetical protein
VHQGQQNVLGADVIVVQGAGLFLSPDDHQARPVGELFEHAASPSRRRPDRAGAFDDTPA